MNIKFYTGDNVDVMRDKILDESIDLTVTSPPYDDLRTYNGFDWDIDAVIEQLWRVTKTGGVVVWVVGDKTHNGSETGTSFRTALKFMDAGWRLHDTMIYTKSKIVPMDFKCHRYYQGFEYMFVFSKGKPKVCNYIRVPSKHSGKKTISINRKEDGSLRCDRVNKQKGRMVGETKIKSNIWEYASQSIKGHPAPFPEQLAEDHILSWSNEGDTVLDIFGGSGTTAKMSLLNKRNAVYIDISEEYTELAKERVYMSNI